MFQQEFNWKRLLGYFIKAFIHAFMLFMAVFGAFQSTSMNDDGVSEDITIIGTALYISVVNTVLL
jgi:hypothetical protein